MAAEKGYRSGCGYGGGFAFTSRIVYLAYYRWRCLFLLVYELHFFSREEECILAAEKGYGSGCGSYGGGFALLIVLFILLIIVGASWCGYGGFK